LSDVNVSFFHPAWLTWCGDQHCGCFSCNSR